MLIDLTSCFVIFVCSKLIDKITKLRYRFVQVCKGRGQKHGRIIIDLTTCFVLLVCSKLKDQTQKNNMRIIVSREGQGMRTRGGRGGGLGRGRGQRTNWVPVGCL